MSPYRGASIGGVRWPLVAAALTLGALAVADRGALRALARLPLSLPHLGAVLVLQVTGGLVADLAGRGDAGWRAALDNLGVVAVFVLPVCAVVASPRARPGLRWSFVLAVGALVGLATVGNGGPGPLLGRFGAAVASADPEAVNRVLFVIPVREVLQARGVVVVAEGSFRHKVLECLVVAAALVTLCPPGAGRSRGGELRHRWRLFGAVVVAPLVALSRALLAVAVVTAGLALACRSGRPGSTVVPLVAGSPEPTGVRRAAGVPLWRWLAGAVVLGAVVPLLPVLATRLDGDDTDSYAVRREALASMTELAAGSPLLGRPAEATAAPVPAHNLAVDWATLYGLCGLAGFGVVGRRCLRSARRVRAEVGPAGLLARHHAVLSLVALVAVRSVTSGGRTFTPAVWTALALLDLTDR